MRATVSKTSTNKLAALLTSLRGQPVKFIESLLSFKGKPLKLYSYQKEIAESVDLLTDHFTVQKARQTGLSFLISAVSVYNVCCFQHTGIFILSKTKDQSSLVFDYLREFLESSRILRHLIDRDGTTKDDLRLTNGSRIVCRSVGMLDAATLRGWSVGMIGLRGACIWDEAQYLPARGLAASLFTSAGGHGECFISSPGRPGTKFHGLCQSDHYKHFVIPARLCPRFSADEIARWRETLSTAEYANEVEARFCQGIECVFDADDIDAAIDPSLPLFGQAMRGDPEKTYHYSIDVSKLRADRFVLMIGELERGVMRVVAYHSWAGTENEGLLDECEFTDNPDRVLEDVYSFHKDKGFHATKIYVDTTSNEYWAHRLQNRYLLNVEEVNWSTSRKEKLISHTQAVLRAGRIKVPNSDLIKRQMLEYAFDLKKMQDNSDKVLYLAGEDDAVSSLAQLCQSVSVRKEYDFHDILITK